MGNSTPPTSYLVNQANQFLAQKEDYEWFVSNKGGAHGEDIYDRRLVVTTFPLDLAKAEFEDYVNKKFSDYPENLRNKIAALFKVIKDCDMEKNISFGYESGKISAVLTQILFEKQSVSKEIKVCFGYTRCIRMIKTDSKLDFGYWNSNEERVTKALQFLFGTELKKELALLG
ncbi:unnamed protein product [Rotaria socialis]|uniref:Uncharacterized protein n=1 Tax=Rotaria socialis TaxID=392032 RepID=A0A818A8H2_9BILA|nr:unnamed protein product [Rotaria socialis]CAF3383127.1 unnamed protein product [Rotaria socialis]CAF3402749.1 unnamed protein product [Rotaria socialis]CAF3701682.1 unnamed protein product [Rotaria socialis]CAF4361873.1 unnamed protein product [Rotaria socialis]